MSGPSPDYRLENHGGNESDQDAGHEDGPAVDKVDHDSLGINFSELERLGRPWGGVKVGHRANPITVPTLCFLVWDGNVGSVALNFWRWNHLNGGSHPRLKKD